MKVGTHLGEPDREYTCGQSNRYGNCPQDDEITRRRLGEPSHARHDEQGDEAGRGGERYAGRLTGKTPIEQKKR